MLLCGASDLDHRGLKARQLRQSSLLILSTIITAELLSVGEKAAPGK